MACGAVVQPPGEWSMSMAAAPPPTESSECRPQPVQVATTPGSWSRFTSAFAPHSAHAQVFVSKSSVRSPVM